MSPASLDSWVAVFRDGVAPADVDAELAKAFLRHLADIGFFRVDGETWTAGDPQSPGDLLSADGIDGGLSDDRLREELQQRLDALSATDKGFVAHFFLAHKTGMPPALPEGVRFDTSPAKTPTADRPPTAGQTALPGRAADLSNLQIVKKLGRQLRPFIELEKNFLAKVTGTFATREDAQKIFHYVFGKTRSKTAPMKWEQLSRRRHK